MYLLQQNYKTISTDCVLIQYNIIEKGIGQNTTRGKRKYFILQYLFKTTKQAYAMKLPGAVAIWKIRIKL